MLSYAALYSVLSGRRGYHHRHYSLGNIPTVYLRGQYITPPVRVLYTGCSGKHASASQKSFVRDSDCRHINYWRPLEFKFKRVVDEGQTMTAATASISIEIHRQKLFRAGDRLLIGIKLQPGYTRIQNWTRRISLKLALSIMIGLFLHSSSISIRTVGIL